MKLYSNLFIVFCCCSLLTTYLNAQEIDSLTVKVRDAANNAPIVEATVRLYDETETLIGEEVTDGNGNAGFNLATLSVDLKARYTTRLGQPYPNPFASHTSIPVSLSSPANLTGAVYDLLGREIATAGRLLATGSHWFDVDLGGLPSGMYLFRLSSRGREIGSTILNYAGPRSGRAAEVRVISGANSIAADKPSAPGTFRLEISHQNYRWVLYDSLEINGKTTQYVSMTEVEFIPEFGTDETRKFTLIADARSGLDVPRDLEFHPLRPYELWVVNRAFDGTVTYWWDPVTDSVAFLRVRDKYANHFMEEVSAIAFSEGELFATAQESINTYDNRYPPNNFMGPALWTADTAIYGKDGLPDWGDLGSHLDMLHESPHGMGIAHDKGNAYWYFDGFYSNIVYYDFQQDHGPGKDDHSDGIVRRYMNAKVKRLSGVPGHMVLDKTTDWLYICDPGNSRVTRLGTKTGKWIDWGNVDTSQTEYLMEYSRYGNATYKVVADKNLVWPSGIALHEKRLFVTDNKTGEIIAFDPLNGKELNRISTAAESIMGIEIGPDGRIWYVDAAKNQLMRIDIVEEPD